VRLDRVEPQRGCRNASKPEHVFGDDDVGLAEDRIAKTNVDAEGLSIELAGQATSGAKAEAVVSHALVLDLGMVIVGTDLEGHEVTKVVTGGPLQPDEDVLRWARHPQIDVLRRARAREPELEHEAAFQDHGVTQRGCDAREEAVEHQKLPLAREVGATSGGRSEALLESLLEGLW
jgi:hypothetical protein